MKLDRPAKSAESELKLVASLYGQTNSTGGSRSIRISRNSPAVRSFGRTVDPGVNGSAAVVPVPLTGASAVGGSYAVRGQLPWFSLA